jgi:hypothetical protein
MAKAQVAYLHADKKGGWLHGLRSAELDTSKMQEFVDKALNCFAHARIAGAPATFTIQGGGGAGVDADFLIKWHQGQFKGKIVVGVTHKSDFRKVFNALSAGPDWPQR